MKFKDAVQIVYGHLPEKIIVETPGPYGKDTPVELCTSCMGEVGEEICQDCNGHGYSCDTEEIKDIDIL